MSQNVYPLSDTYGRSAPTFLYRTYIPDLECLNLTILNDHVVRSYRLAIGSMEGLTLGQPKKKNDFPI